MTMRYASRFRLLVAGAGLLLSFHFDLPSGPATILMTGLAYGISLTLGPVGGLAAGVAMRRRLEI